MDVTVEYLSQQWYRRFGTPNSQLQFSMWHTNITNQLLLSSSGTLLHILLYLIHNRSWFCRFSNRASDFHLIKFGSAIRDITLNQRFHWFCFKCTCQPIIHTTRHSIKTRVRRIYCNSVLKACCNYTLLPCSSCDRFQWHKYGRMVGNDQISMHLHSFFHNILC